MRESLRKLSAKRHARRRLESVSWFAVVRAYEECSRRYAQMLQELDLTATQFDVLAAIDYLGEDALPKAIAERLLVTRANISGVLRRLQEQKRIRTRPHGDDARSFVCALTPRGRALVERASTSSQRFIRAQLAPFSDEELTLSEGFMQRMHTHLQTLDPLALAHDSPEGSAPPLVTEP